MKNPKINEAAQLLLAARTREITLDQLPAHCLPDDAAEAYAIQEQVTLALGEVGGWKVGAAGPGMPPACAALPAQRVFAAPHAVADWSVLGQCGIEVEIAVRIEHDLPARSAPYTQSEVLAAVAAIHPAIELVASRYATPGAGALAALADSLSNHAFIYGPGRSTLGQIDQTSQRAILQINGQEVVNQVGGNPAGDIWVLVTWLANHLRERGDGLKAGQFVTTGSCTGVHFASANSKVSGILEQVGAVDISFAEA